MTPQTATGPSPAPSGFHGSLTLRQCPDLSHLNLTHRAAVLERLAQNAQRVLASARALTNGFDRAFLVGAGFAVAGAVLSREEISTMASHELSMAVRSGEPAPAAAAG